MLKSFLENSRARTAAAAAKAAAEAEARAKAKAAAEEKAAEKAFSGAIVALEDAAVVAEANGGNPAIADYMTGLTDWIANGGPTQAELDQAVADKEAALANAQLWRDNANQLETHVRTVNAEKDDLLKQLADVSVECNNAIADLGTARSELSAANTVNSNLQSDFDMVKRERDQARIDANGADAALNQATSEKDALQDRLDAIEQEIAVLPMIDLTRRTVGGSEIKLKLGEAQERNEQLQSLRNRFNLDAPPPAAPAPVPAPHPVPGA